MTTTDTPDLLYLGRSRLHRNRANLIQTLHSVAALSELGVATRLYLPPWHSSVSLDQRLREMGIERALDVRPLQWLHRRWPPGILATLQGRQLRRTRALYVRSEELSLALAAHGIPHHLELHSLRALIQTGQLDRLIHYHQRGLIGQLLPISAAIAERLIERGAEAQRVHLCPSGVKLTAYAATPPLDRKRLVYPRSVYIGRISPDRGLGILLHLARSGIGQVRLIGETDAPIEVGPHLCYLGSIPHREVPAHYAESELVLLPYQPDLEHADGISPMKLFEAMAAGRVILASDIPPIREVIQDGHNGLLVDPTDPDAWLRAVQRLRHDPELALRLGAQARRDAQSYAWPQRARRIAAALQLISL